MDIAEFRHMIGHAGPVRTAERLVLHTIIPVSPITSDEIELRPPYLTSVREIMSQTGTKTARTVNRYLDNLVAAGWLSIERPADGTLVFTPRGPGQLRVRLPRRRALVTRAARPPHTRQVLLQLAAPSAYPHRVRPENKERG
jgi:hypothetical protein